MVQSDNVSVDSQENEITNDTSYDSGCESGSPVSTCSSSNRIYQTRPKKKSRNMINLTDLEVHMLKAIAILTNERDKGPTIDDCHEKLKGPGLEHTDPMYLAAFTLFELILIFCPKVEMSRDVLTVGSTMRIPLLYRGEYSQWVKRFMNYLEEQTDGEAMINSIKNDNTMWSDQEKRIQKIDRLARSLLIQGLPNDIYSLIDINKTAKDLWDALPRHMLGSEYGEQDRKATVLYEYETFKATEGELLLDTYIRY
nr:hypothetical protein [Tanacetum cinerariifolium]